MAAKANGIIKAGQSMYVLNLEDSCSISEEEHLDQFGALDSSLSSRDLNLDEEDKRPDSRRPEVQGRVDLYTASEASQYF